MLEGVVAWPPELARRYRERSYWEGVTLGEAFDRSVTTNAERVAVVDGPRRITYRQLAGLVDRLGLHLAQRGISGGRVAVFQLPNVLEFVIAYFACLKVGAIPLTCLPAHRHAEIGYLAKFTDAAAWFVAAELRGFDYIAMAEELHDSLPALREIFVAGERAGRGMTRIGDLLDDPIEARISASALEGLRPRPGDVAVFQLSGGTTGLPKVIPRTHDDYLYNSKAFAAAASFDRESVLLVSVPIAHNFPLACPGVQGRYSSGRGWYWRRRPTRRRSFP